ncbi:hypothetical protein MOV74_19680 [Bradyrhizobium sp. SHOUNA76]|nr:hypothetical protein [Bradyrhizobium sp. SHOUNA76]MCJ9730138.1 hypothetical protein [Bradyrhizobium sp. PRIMUS42]
MNDQKRYVPAAEGRRQSAHHLAQGDLLVGDADQDGGRPLMERRPEEAGQRPLIEAVYFHILDRRTDLILQAPQADIEPVREVAIREISRTRHTSRDFERRQRAQPRFQGNRG